MMMTDYQRLKEMQDIIGKLYEDEKDNCPPDPEVPFLDGEEIIRSYYHEEIEEKIKTYGLLFNHVTRLIESSSEAPGTLIRLEVQVEGWRSMAFSLKRRLDQLQQLLGTSEVCDNTLHIESKDIPRHHPKVAYD